MISGAVHFEDHPALAGDAAPIVLCHGLLCTSAVWGGLREPLRRRRRVIAVDLRGHGGSVAQSGAVTLDDLAGDVLAVLDQLQLDRAIVVGSSLGGMIALRLALHAPGRVAALMLMGTQAQAETAKSRAGYRTTLRAIERVGARPVLRRLATLNFGATTRRTRPELIAAWVDACAALDPARMLPVVEAALTRDDAQALLPRITCPALVLHGEEDALVSAESAAALARDLAAGALVTVAAAGHLAPLEQPAEVARVVGAFVDGLGT